MLFGDRILARPTYSLGWEDELPLKADMEETEGETEAAP